MNSRDFGAPGVKKPDSQVAWDNILTIGYLEMWRKNAGITAH